MRGPFLALVAAALAASGVLSSAAYDAASGAARAVTLHVVGDAAGYLSVRAVSGLHRCFVSEDATTGKIVIDFSSAASCPNAGAGAGVNAGAGTAYARYAFHDLLAVRNAGQRDVWVWVNASTTDPPPNALEVAKKAATGGMTDADYAASSATGLLVPSASEVFVGVRVNATLAAGSTLSGQITIDARR